MLLARAAHPEHVVEEEVVVVGRREPLELEVRPVDHDLAELPDLGMDAERGAGRRRSIDRRHASPSQVHRERRPVSLTSPLAVPMTIHPGRRALGGHGPAALVSAQLVRQGPAVKPERTSVAPVNAALTPRQRWYGPARAAPGITRRRGLQRPPTARRRAASPSGTRRTARGGPQATAREARSGGRAAWPPC